MKFRQAATTSTLILIVVAAALISFPKARVAGGATLRNLRNIFATTIEQRKVATYAGYGYAYVSEVLKHYPIPDGFPVTRYTDWTKNVHLFFPQKVKTIDSEIMLALDVAETDLIEGPIANLAQTSVENMWQFSTIVDYDTLSGFTFIPQTCAAESVSIGIDVYSTIGATEPIGKFAGDATCTPGEATDIKLEKVVDNFAFSRGSLPFSVKIVAAAATWERISAIGTKINTEGYTLLNKTGNSYTFVNTNVLNGATEQQDPLWLNFISKFKNV